MPYALIRLIVSGEKNTMQKNFQSLPEDFQLDEYRIVKVLGHGGFGITYLAEDTNLYSKIALKEYMPNMIAFRSNDMQVQAKSADDQEEYEWGLDSFLNEARVLAGFSHPNIVSVNRFFRQHGTAYIVMQLIEGETLSQMLRRMGPLSQEEWQPLLSGLMKGLSVVHRSGTYHRDIKPGNILIDGSGNPVLIDFGAARQSVSSKSMEITAIVTQGYSPIEQYSTTGELGPWTDIYALAATSYFALTGEKPPEAANRIMGDKYVPLSQKLSGQADPDFLEMLDWALSVNHKDRPQSIDSWNSETASFDAPEPDTSHSARAQNTDPVTQSRRTYRQPPSFSPEDTVYEDADYTGQKRRKILPFIIGLSGLVACGALMFTLYENGTFDNLNSPETVQVAEKIEQKSASKKQAQTFASPIYANRWEVIHLDTLNISGNLGITADTAFRIRHGGKVYLVNGEGTIDLGSIRNGDIEVKAVGSSKGTVRLIF